MMKVSKLSNKNYLREKQNIGVSTLIIKEFYGSTIVLLYLRTVNYVKKILDEAHLSKFSIHPDSTKMYHVTP
jgi:hypothetical protein